MKTNILDVPKASEINEHQDQWAGAGKKFLKHALVWITLNEQKASDMHLENT
jgi:hypothetical protein